MVPVAAASSPTEALELLRDAPADVAVIDYWLAQSDGLALCRRLKTRSDVPRVVIYSAYVAGALVVPSFVAGADALVTKGAPADELFEGIRLAFRGERVLPRPASAGMAMAAEALEYETLPLLGMLIEGTPRPEIAEVLGLDPSELEARIDAMLGKLKPRLERSS